MRPAGLGRILDTRLDELHRILVALRPLALAEHIDDERDIARAGQRLGARDDFLGDAEPVGRDQEQRALRLDAVVVDKLATAGEVEHGIFD